MLHTCLRVENLENPPFYQDAFVLKKTSERFPRLQVHDCLFGLGQDDSELELTYNTSWSICHRRWLCSRCLEYPGLEGLNAEHKAKAMK